MATGSTYKPSSGGHEMENFKIISSELPSVLIIYFIEILYVHIHTKLFAFTDSTQ